MLALEGGGERQRIMNGQIEIECVALARDDSRLDYLTTDVSATDASTCPTYVYYLSLTAAAVDRSSCSVRICKGKTSRYLPLKINSRTPRRKRFMNNHVDSSCEFLSRTKGQDAARKRFCVAEDEARLAARAPSIRRDIAIRESLIHLKLSHSPY